MDEGLDSGPVYSSHTVPILPNEDAGSLTQRLGQLAAEVLREDLGRVLDGSLQAIPQDVGLVSLAPPIRHEHQVIDFRTSAVNIVRRIRALSPKPGAVTQLRQNRVKIAAAVVAEEPTIGPPGRVTLMKHRILVSTGDATLEVTRLQLEGKPVQSATDVINGRRILDGDDFGTA
jgi:methionyl-tRNA formyltransferase